MKILQLASFVGNQGDVTNHKNFRSWFDGLTMTKNFWEEIEIRGFFREEYKYENFFPDFANQFDLLVIGGGNFFELWPSNSWSGTSIGLTPEMLEKLTVPIFINSIGVDSAQGISENAHNNFGEFIKLLLNKDSLISVRNDGSYDEIRKHVSDLVMEDIHVLPDAGLFCAVPPLTALNRTGSFIAVNLALDMKEKRFEKLLHNGYPSFIDHFANDLENILSSGFADKIVFTSHIHSDLQIGLDVVEKLSEKTRREKILFSKFGPDSDSNQALIDTYFRAELTLAMRFHANLIPIGLGRPVFGISTYPQIEKVYKEIHMAGNSLMLDKDNRVQGLLQSVENYFKEPDSALEKSALARVHVQNQRDQFNDVLVNWLSD